MKREGKDAEETYQLFEQFLERVIVNGKSFLTEGAEELPLEAFEDCYKRYIDKSIAGSDQSYDEKIQEQFNKKEDQEALLILAHAIWLWAFGVNDISQGRKKRYTSDLLGAPFALKENTYPEGVGSAGLWHRQNKYSEIAFTFLLIRHLRNELDQGKLKKEKVRNRIEEICLCQKYTTHEAIEEISDLEKELPNNSLATANILLHFVNPSKYEPIASDGHKKQIISSFSGLLDNEVTKDEALNRDQKIKEIRKAIAEYEEKDFSFYDRKLKKVWNYSAILKDFDEMEGLEYKKAIILYGPPGTSKTYAASEIAESLITKHFLKDKQNVKKFFESDDSKYLKDRITKLQLHPSYTYEDFVAGMQLENDETKPVPGKLFEICKEACKDLADDEEDQTIPHVLILDEINRVDLSLLFGEVFSLLENRNEEMSVAVGEGEDFELEIPNNLYVIGTMNEIDFSLERIDFALRRRFLWYNYEFNADRLKKIIKMKEKGGDLEVDLGEKQIRRFISNATALNEKIAELDQLGKQYQIGHTFFAEVVDVYKRYKVINGHTSQIKNKIFRDDGPAEILWDISIEPIIESFFGSMNPVEVDKQIGKLKEIYLREID